MFKVTDSTKIPTKNSKGEKTAKQTKNERQNKIINKYKI